MYLPLLYKTITRRDGGTGKNFSLCIDWSKTTDKEVFNYACLIQLKEIEKLHFIRVNQEENNDLLDFLVNKSPKKLNAFTFNAYCENGSGDFYLKGFEKIASVTSKKFCICYFKFSKSAFESILKASANCKEVVFYRCDLDLDSDVDISGPKYSTSCLSIIDLGYYSELSEESKSEILHRIIKAISLSSLKDSLKTLDFSACKVDEYEIQKKLKEFNLEHINVIAKWHLNKKKMSKGCFANDEDY